jgi:hypothetical protein
MQVELGEASLFYRRHQLSLDFYIKTKRLMNESLLPLELKTAKENHKLMRLAYKTHNLPFVVRCHLLETHFGTKSMVSLPLKRHYTPPWNTVGILVDEELQKNVTKSELESAIRTKMLAHINQQKTEVIIYTDGSKDEDSRCGATFTSSLGESKSIRIQDGYSIATCELTAILLATTWFSNNNSIKSATIYWDSHAAILSLQKVTKTVKNPLVERIRGIMSYLNNNGYSVELSWIPVHVAVRSTQYLSVRMWSTCMRYTRSIPKY